MTKQFKISCLFAQMVSKWVGLILSTLSHTHAGKCFRTDCSCSQSSYSHINECFTSNVPLQSSSTFTNVSLAIIWTMLAYSCGWRACICLHRLDVLPCGWRMIRLHKQHQKSQLDSWSKWTFIRDERESAWHTQYAHMWVYTAAMQNNVTRKQQNWRFWCSLICL